jgi:hypothetical protein
MHILGHNHIAVDAKSEAAPHALQSDLKDSSAGGCREQRATTVAAEGHEVGLAGLLKSL